LLSLLLISSSLSSGCANEWSACSSWLDEAIVVVDTWIWFVADPMLWVVAGLFWVFCLECCSLTRFLVTRWKSELDPVTQDLNLRN
jgi:hypothetical protein